MNNSPSRNTPLILNLNESLSNSNSSKNYYSNSNKTSNYKNIYSSYSSHHSSKKVTLNANYRNNISGYFKFNKYNDKVEKKMYLENINIKTKRNTELLSKLSSTYKTYKMYSNSKDPLIESNLFKIGTKRSFLLSKRMNQVRNMIQDFDNEFSVNLNINKNKKILSYNKNDKKKSLQKIEEESFDFDLNKINTKNKSKNDIENNDNNLVKSKNSLKKNSLMIKTNIFDNIEDLKKKKGTKFLKYQKIFEKNINNSEKMLQLTDAFKYYELLYNYKYFLTKKDNEFLSFSRRKKMKRAFSSYYSTIKTKLFNYEDKKCNQNKKNDFQQYKNSMKINLLNFVNISNEDNNNYHNTQREKTNINKKELKLSLENSEKKQKNLKRAFSGFIPQNNNNQNLITINSKYNKNTIRPTSSTISQTAQSTKHSNSNKQQFNTKINLDLDLDSVFSDISSFNNQNIINKKKTSNINKKNLSLPKKIRNLSEGIIDVGGKLKTEIKSKYKSIMKQLEDDKKPVTKVKKDRNINIKKIRQDLNLRRRGNGIDEQKLIMDNVNKLYKSLPKKHVNLMRSIAKIVINEDRMRHRPLFYNDIYDNKLFKMRLKNEMFDAQCEMAKIRKTLSKNKKEKDFKQQVKKLMKNDMFLFFDVDSLKQALNKYKVLRGECLANN